MVDTNIPRNLKECVAEFQRVFSEEQVNKFKDMSPDDLIDCHFGLGMWIRNNWLYPQGSPLRKAFYDVVSFMQPDDVSGFITGLIYNSLNGREIDEESMLRFFEGSAFSRRVDPEAMKRLIG